MIRARLVGGIGEEPNTMLAEDYISEVYRWSLTYWKSLREEAGHPEWDVYDVIRHVHVVTADRLRGLGAFENSELLDMSMTAFQFLTNSMDPVPVAWATEWRVAAEAAVAKYKPAAEDPDEFVKVDLPDFDYQGTGNTPMDAVILLGGLYVVADAWGETKRGIKKKIS